MWSQRVQEERIGIMCWADLGPRGWVSRGQWGRRSDLSGYHYVKGEVFSVLLSIPPPLYLRLHFSPRAKVRRPGERWKVKGNMGRAPGRRLSLAMQLDLLTYNLKFYSPSFFLMLFFATRVSFSYHCQTKLGLMKCPLLNFNRLNVSLRELVGGSLPKSLRQNQKYRHVLF